MTVNARNGFRFRKSFIIPILFMASLSAQNTIIVGTYTNSKDCNSGGIYVFDFDENTYDYQLKFHTDNIINPSFVSLSPDRNNLFAVNENGDKSTVTAFKMDGATGTLTKTDEKPTNGEDPCFLITDQDHIIVANYSGGSINVFKRSGDAQLSEVVQNITFSGKGHHPERQEKSHIHQVQFSQDHQYLLATDLGLDKIYVFKYHPSDRQPLEKFGEFDTKKGSGPRHLAFNKKGNLIYLVQELSGDLSVLSFENENLKLLQEETLISRNVHFKFRAADVHLTDKEDFLYVTNRDDADDITTFKILNNGLVQKVQQIKTTGRNPRNFAISPNNRLVLIANQDTNRINIFTRDAQSGKLTATRHSIPVCAPVNVIFYEKGQ